MNMIIQRLYKSDVEVSNNHHCVLFDYENLMKTRFTLLPSFKIHPMGMVAAIIYKIYNIKSNDIYQSKRRVFFPALIACVI